jgi:hypothetical protein
MIPVPSTIPTGLATDVTQDLLDFFATVPLGQSEDVLINAVYRVDQPFKLTGVHGVDIEWAPGAEFRRVAPQADREACHLELNHCNYMTLRNPTIRGCKPAGAGYRATLEAQHAILTSSSADINIIDMHVSDVYGDQLCCGSDRRTLKVWSQQIYVVNGKNGESARHALCVTSGRDIRVSGLAWGSCRTGIDLEPNGSQGGAVDITVQSCQWWGHRLNWMAAFSPKAEGIVDGVTLVDNKSFGAPLSIAVTGGQRRSNFYVVNNWTAVSVGQPDGSVMDFNGVSGDLDIRDNVQPLNPGRNMRVARWDAYTAANADITYSGNTPDTV